MEYQDGIQKPIGTVEEVQALGLSLNRTGTCAAPTKGDPETSIRGCPHFGKCRFLAWKNRQNGRAGPLNIGVQVVLSQVEGGHSDQKVMHCHEWYSQNWDTRQRYSADSGEIVRIIAYEGDGKKLKCKTGVRVDAAGKPVSPLDTTSRATKYVYEEVEVPLFRRPAEMLPEQVRLAEERQEMMDSIERAALADALGTHPDIAPPPAKAEAPQPVKVARG